MQDQLLQLLNKHRNSYWGLIIGYLLIFLIVVSIDNFLEKGISSFGLRLVIYLTIGIAWSFVWNRLRMNFPRTDKNKIGMIISISAEEIKQTGRIRTDFVENINKLLKRHGLYEKFQVIVTNELQSEAVGKVLNAYVEKKEGMRERGEFNKLAATKEKRRFVKLNKRIMGHFYIWGSIKERKNIENTYVIGLDCLVMHSPIELEASKKLSEEISMAFPRGISFYEKVELIGFSEASRYVLIGARYIIGIAALISGDVSFAYNLHKGLWDELRGHGTLPDPHKHMLTRLKDIMQAELLLKCRYAQYRERNLNKAKEFMDEAEKIESQSYPALVFNSIYAFKVERNIVRAMKYLRTAKKKSRGDSIWLYNKAFLNMYAEKFKAGLSDYNRLGALSFEKEEMTVAECVDFNKGILQKEPEKIQSKFILAWLLYIKQGNLPEALGMVEDFQKDAESNPDFEILIARSDELSEMIKKEMGIVE